MMRHLLLYLLALGTAAAAVPTELYNGKDLTGLELVTIPAADIATVCHVTDGGVLAISGKPVGYLLAAGSYENYSLHVEYRWPKDAPKNSNSGVLVHIASGPIDRNTWPLCFQIQTKMSRAGDLLPMAGAKFAEPLTSPPGAKTQQLDRLGVMADNAPGEWNTIDVVCRNSTIRVTVNDVVENRVTNCEPHAGKIGLQLEGLPFELRIFRITPLP
jgi:hypothetical protein